MMDFIVESKEQALEAAKNAEFTGGNYVKVHGAYFGPIQSCIFKKFASGSGGMEITIKTEEGLLCKSMIITMTKEGKSTYKNSKGEELPLPGINMIRGGLMPILQQRELKALKKSEDEIEYPAIVGKNLGMLVDIVKTYAKDKKTGKIDTTKVYENTDLKGFFCPLTGKTGSELLEGKDAEKKAKIEENLKTVEPVIPADADKGGSKSDPFGDMGSQPDPFAQGTSAGAADQGKQEDPFGGTQSAETQTPAPEQKKEEVKEPTPAPVEQQPAADPTPAATGGDSFWN